MGPRDRRGAAPRARRRAAKSRSRRPRTAWSRARRPTRRSSSRRSIASRPPATATRVAAVVRRRAVHFITDGAMARPLDPAVVVHSVFEPAPTSRSPRSTSGRRSAGKDRCRRRPISRSPTSRPAADRCTSRSAAGTATICSISRLDMAAGEALRRSCRSTRGGDPRLRAHVEARRQRARVDDEAFAWIARAPPLAVTVVGDEHRVARACCCSGDPDVRATFVPPRRLQAGSEDVVDLRSLGAAGRAGHAGALLRAAGGRVLARRDRQRSRRRRSGTAAGSHPVVRGVDPFTFVDRARARCYQLRALTPIAAVGDGHAARLRRRVGGSARRSSSRFGAADSNLASAPAFPVLMATRSSGWRGRGRRSPRSAGADDVQRGACQRSRGPDGAAVPADRRARRRRSASSRARALLVGSGRRAEHVRRERRAIPQRLESDATRRLSAGRDAVRRARRARAAVVAVLRAGAFVARARRVVDVAAADHGVMARHLDCSRRAVAAALRSAASGWRLCVARTNFNPRQRALQAAVRSLLLAALALALARPVALDRIVAPVDRLRGRRLAQRRQPRDRGRGAADRRAQRAASARVTARIVAFGATARRSRHGGACARSAPIDARGIRQPMDRSQRHRSRGGAGAARGELAPGLRRPASSSSATASRHGRRRRERDRAAGGGAHPRVRRTAWPSIARRRVGRSDRSARADCRRRDVPGDRHRRQPARGHRDGRARAGDKLLAATPRSSLAGPDAGRARRAGSTRQALTCSRRRSRCRAIR